MNLTNVPAKAGLSEKIGYGFGDLSSSMFWKIFSYYLPIFYSDVFGLKPQHAAFLLLVTKLYDAVSDPVMGIIADRTETKWGKYRPYLLWIALPFAIVGVMSFFTPNWGYAAKHLYAYVTYLLMMTVYTAINVPYGAMLGVMTDDPHEKSVFSSYRMFFAYIGSFLSMGIFAIFEKQVGGSVGNAAPGQWTAWVGVIAVICLIFFLLCFAMTRERVKPEPKEQGSIGKDIKALVSNGPWWLLLGGSIGILLFNSIRGGSAAYYFSNVLGTNALLTCAVFLLVGELAQWLGVVFAVPISDRIGKKATFLSVLIVTALLSCIVWFLPNTPGGFWTLMVLQVLICIAIGINSPMLWSMFADVADYSELKHGTSSTGLIFSSSSMAQKFGGAFGAFLLMQVLAWAGYVAGADVQSDGTLSAIKALMSFIPAIGSLIGIVCLAFYPLTTKKVKEIQAELEVKRNQK